MLTIKKQGATIPKLGPRIFVLRVSCLSIEQSMVNLKT